MKGAGLKGIVRSKSPRTTRPAAETERPADLVERSFVADAPNQPWVADIIYCRTFSGWVYAAFVIDVFSRMVVGWQVADQREVPGGGFLQSTAALVGQRGSDATTIAGNGSPADQTGLLQLIHW